MMRLVTVCPRHRTVLVNRCPSCQKSQPLLARNNTRPFECTSCTTWLGGETFSVAVENEELLAWQEGIWTVLQELQAASLVAGMIKLQAFFPNTSPPLPTKKSDFQPSQTTMSYDGHVH